MWTELMDQCQYKETIPSMVWWLKKGFSASLSNQGRKAFNMGQLWWKLTRQTDGDKGECVDKDFLIKKSTYAVSSSEVGGSICFVMASPL